MIISLSGVALSGKDEVAKCVQRIDSRYQIKGFSQKLKQISELLTGIPYKHWEDQEFKRKPLAGWDMDARTFLQRLGTEAIRDGLHPDAWVMAMMADYREGDCWVVKDTRFLNEFETLKMYGAVCIQVIRPGYRAVNNHVSERSLDKVCFDDYIINDGTLEDLQDKVTNLIKNI